MNLQLEKEENQMKEMMKAMREQSMLQRAAGLEPSESKTLGASQPTQPTAPPLGSSQLDQTK